MPNLKKTTPYSINDFINWNINQELVLSPKYQRNPVWTENAKSYLIDSILRGYPIPPIYIRQRIDLTTRKTIREVIDGQQRLRAIIDFYNDKFRIHRTHNQTYPNKIFSELPDDVKLDFLRFEISVEVIQIEDDAYIYDMFARLNTNNVVLNKQELRNAKFRGEFKVFVYLVASEWRDIFLENKVFSESKMTRMADVEMVSMFIINIVDGFTTDTPTYIDSFYKKYDVSFSKENIVWSKLDDIREMLENIFKSNQFDPTLFHTKNYFYTLFCFLNHHMFGTENCDIRRLGVFDVTKIKENINLLIEKLMLFQAEFNNFFETETSILNIDFIKFRQYHQSRTTNKNEREERVKILTEAIEQLL
ncbi:DUF262 domain-containing protein [Sphaerochaeta halotolerans]|nr:DUF262 domain-containing protein [Sphaerochaeta halotolerans]